MEILSYLLLGISLLFLAAIWPPYNVFIAESIVKKDKWMLFAIPVSSVLGLTLSVLMIFWGAEVLGFSLSIIGGIVVILLGIKMFFSPPSEGKVNLGEKVSMLFTVFLVSAIPGVYAFTAASGLQKGDLLQVLTVYLAGPIFGITLGGFLLAFGFKISKLPLNKVGSLLLLLIGIKMIFF
jgi:small neutral amino acid transporter SnatA (MarC family)